MGVIIVWFLTHLRARILLARILRAWVRDVHSEPFPVLMTVDQAAAILDAA